MTPERSEEDEWDTASKELSEAGRVCTEPECVTVLSVYNPTDRCTQHARHWLPVGRLRRKRARR